MPRMTPSKPTFHYGRLGSALNRRGEYFGRERHVIGQLIVRRASPIVINSSEKEARCPIDQRIDRPEILPPVRQGQRLRKPRGQTARLMLVQQRRFSERHLRSTSSRPPEKGLHLPKLPGRVQGRTSGSGQSVSVMEHEELGLHCNLCNEIRDGMTFRPGIRLLHCTFCNVGRDDRRNERFRCTFCNEPRRGWMILFRRN